MTVGRGLALRCLQDTAGRFKGREETLLFWGQGRLVLEIAAQEGLVSCVVGRWLE